MDKVKIDLLRQKYHLEDTTGKKPFLFFGRMLAILLIVVSVTGIIFSYQVNATSEGSGFRFSFFSTIRGLVASGDRQLAGEENGRINVLLMGIGGAGHSGPQLTDTMIFASFQPEEKKVAMISIPRDLSVPIPGHDWNKINHANAYGEADAPGTGPLLAKEVVESALNQDINYYVRVDFDGFAQLIDDIGGIDVYVENAFTDASYPSHGKEYAECGTEQRVLENDEVIEVPVYTCRFERLSFDEGWTHMDGDTALKFVRSRHGTNGEGSDFARGRRQQKILGAVKDEIFSASTILNPARISRILETLEGNISTNMEEWEIIRLANLFKDVDTSQVVHHVLDSSPSSPLYATSQNGAYVLLPKQDDWRPIHELAEHIFEETTPPSEPPPGAPEPKNTDAKIEIQNGTKITGFASRASQMLDGQGYDVVKIGNAIDQEQELTIIYDFSHGEQAEARTKLEAFLHADFVRTETEWIHLSDAQEPPDISEEAFADAASTSNIDFLVILGENSAYLMNR